MKALIIISMKWNNKGMSGEWPSLETCSEHLNTNALSVECVYCGLHNCSIFDYMHGVKEINLASAVIIDAMDHFIELDGFKFCK
jgi:hypothetical protein